MLFGIQPLTITTDLYLPQAIELLELVQRYYNKGFGTTATFLELRGAETGKKSPSHHLRITLEVAWGELKQQMPEIYDELAKLFHVSP